MGGVRGSLHNIGSRPATEVHLSVLLDGTSVGTPEAITLIKPDQMATWGITYDPNQTGIRANAQFTLECTYLSITGDHFRTVKRYRPDEQHDFEVWYMEATDKWTQLSTSQNFDPGEPDT
jgi:hypothetical protein